MFLNFSSSTTVFKIVLRESKRILYMRLFYTAQNYAIGVHPRGAICLCICMWCTWVCGLYEKRLLCNFCMANLFSNLRGSQLINVTIMIHISIRLEQPVRRKRGYVVYARLSVNDALWKGFSVSTVCFKFKLSTSSIKNMARVLQNGYHAYSRIWYTHSTYKVTKLICIGWLSLKFAIQKLQRS